jgi:hypothetical protein
MEKTMTQIKEKFKQTMENEMNRTKGVFSAAKLAVDMIERDYIGKSKVIELLEIIERGVYATLSSDKTTLLAIMANYISDNGMRNHDGDQLLAPELQNPFIGTLMIAIALDDPDIDVNVQIVAQPKVEDMH